jgi:hypothetical protein
MFKLLQRRNILFALTTSLAIGSVLQLTLIDALADEVSVPILDQRISGHIHPSICKTSKGSLIVVFKGQNVLMWSRSSDAGTTWSQPLPIKTSATRPESIRQVKKFEVYPGTADTLPDGRVLVTWNYIADDKATDGYYERALLYSISQDEGTTWSDQRLIGPIANRHLGAVRHNVLPWKNGRWLLPLRTGVPRVYDSVSGTLVDFPLKVKDGKQHEFQQIIRTSKDTLIALGPELLRSEDSGASWKSTANFPAEAKARDNLEGRFLTPLSQGRVLVTWGVGNDNTGLRYAISNDDGLTWSPPIVLLEKTKITARYYSARTIQLDEKHVGTVFMNRAGVHFVRVAIKRFAQE